MKWLLRLLIIVVSSPVWLFIGAIAVPICIMLLLVTLIGAAVEYGFTGEWSWL